VTPGGGVAAGYSPAWLRLRAGADSAARATSLLAALGRALPIAPPGAGPQVICDLGCGTGAMARWLAPRLPGRQHWIMYDRDPALLAEAAAVGAADGAAVTAADGAAVTAATRRLDLSTLTAADLAGACLVTASALLDVLTRTEIDRLAAACVAAGCPALLTLTVSGHVTFTPSDPLDGEIGAAFNAHQRRGAGRRRPAGPAAADIAAAAFNRLGAVVRVRASPWRLGPADTALIGEWLPSRVAAACAQQPALSGVADAYLRRRLAAAADGALRVTVGHHDLLATGGFRGSGRTGAGQRGAGQEPARAGSNRSDSA
jgi:hypothetical protein